MYPGTYPRMPVKVARETGRQAPAGLPHVLVNGVFAVRDGQCTGARGGRVLRAQ